MSKQDELIATARGLTLDQSKRADDILATIGTLQAELHSIVKPTMTEICDAMVTLTEAKQEHTPLSANIEILETVLENRLLDIEAQGEEEGESTIQ